MNRTYERNTEQAPVEHHVIVEVQHGETNDEALARTVTTPECLSASVLSACKDIDILQPIDLIHELKQQTAAIHANDLTRVESMLMCQAHTLDSLFSTLATRAMVAPTEVMLDRYMRLALKSQNQARATLQTLGELKAPKQVAFVRQANIGAQVQVNNGSAPESAPARKSQKKRNELLEVTHDERLDTRAASAAGGADKTMATVGAKHGASNC